MKTDPLHAIPIICLLFISSALHGVDSPGPEAVKTTIDNFNSFSWDSASGGWVELKNVKTVTDTYGKDRRILERDITYDKGAIIEKTVYKYSIAGWRKTTYDHENKLMRFSEVIRNGDKVTETVYHPDKSVFAKFIVETDGNGIPLKSEQYDGQGKLVWRIVFTNDSDGRCSKASYYNADGSIAFESTFEYGKVDKNGNWTMRTEYCSYADVSSRPKEVAYREIEYAE